MNDLENYFQPQRDLAAEQEELRRQKIGMATENQRLGYYATSGGADMGQGFGRAIGSALGADMRPESQKRNDAVEAVKQAVRASGAQPGTDDYFRTMQEAFTQQGLHDAALSVQKAWDQAKLTRSHAEYYDRGNREKPLTPQQSMQNKLDQFLSQRVEMDDSDPQAANLDKAIDRLRGALGIRPDATTKDEWVVVQGTKDHGPLMYNRRTGGTKPLPGVAGGGRAPQAPGAFDDLPPAMRKKAEEAAGKDIAEWLANGRSSALRGIEALSDVRARLEQNPDLVNDPLSSRLPDAMRALTEGGRAAIQAKATVQTAVQQTLRQTLGSQFTEKEAKEMFERAWDPRLTAKENLERLDRVIVELKDQMAAKDALSRGERPQSRELRQPNASLTRAQEEWIGRALKSNPGMTRDEVVREGRRLGRI